MNDKEPELFGETSFDRSARPYGNVGLVVGVLFVLYNGSTMTWAGIFTVLMASYYVPFGIAELMVKFDVLPNTDAEKQEAEKQESERRVNSEAFGRKITENPPVKERTR